MKNKTIVAFHIGRGGRFNNQGHLSFIGTKEICSFIGDLSLKHENLTKFEKRVGYDISHEETPSIIDLIDNKNFELLEEAYGITEEMLGAEIFFDFNGNPVGLTDAEVDTGIGRIEQDGDFDTTYTKYLSDCTEAEIEAIRNSQEWSKDDLLAQLETA